MAGQITQRLTGQLPLPKQNRDYNQSHYISLNFLHFLLDFLYGLFPLYWMCATREE